MQKMQRALLIKAIIVLIVFGIVMVPLSMIRGIVLERAARQQAVAQEVAATSFGRQLFAGPVLSLPYTEEFEELAGDGREQRIEKRRLERALRLYPTSSELAGNIAVGEKHRGLFKVRTFNWQGTVQGDFVLDGKIKLARSRTDSHIVLGRPVVSLGLSDPRGLVGAPAFEWSGQRIAFERGSMLPGVSAGLHAELSPIDPTQPQRMLYTLALSLQGTQSLAIVPVADNTKVRVSSDWPHPSFGGQFLPQPELQQINRNGFVAQWTISALASSAQQQLQALFESNKDDMRHVERLEVGFFEPIDVYSLSDRALKYGFLFVGLTFACFLMFEVIKRAPVHPAQYALVGFALATFFLLLIALSEHVTFWIAYGVAAGACIALIGFYSSAVLRGAHRGLSFSIVLTALYGALYGLLVSEDYALLLGSTLIFALLATVMLATRGMDWYRAGANDSAAQSQLVS